MRTSGRAPSKAADAPGFLLAAEFKGGRLTPVEETTIVDRPALQVFRSKAMASALVRDKRSFGGEIAALVADLDTVDVTEFLITAIELDRAQGLARTEVRYDIVGRGPKAGRAERVGRWSLRWRRDPDGAWRVLEWTASEHQHSRAAAPIFAEVTSGRLRGKRLLPPPAHAWASTPGSPPSTRTSPATRTATTASRSGTPTATASTTSTSRSPRACRTGSTGTGATAPSRT